MISLATISLHGPGRPSDKINIINMVYNENLYAVLN